MKRFLVIFTLFFSILINIFAQETQNKTHTIYVDLYPMVNGIVSGGVGLALGYEHGIGKYFAVGSEVCFVSDFNDIVSYSITLSGFFYPIKIKIGNLFVEEELGYRRRRSNYDGSNDNIHCLMGLTNIGWKFTFFNNLVFIPEFGIRYDIATFYGNEEYKFGYMIKIKVGWVF
jgi:hypothetical protein